MLPETPSSPRVQELRRTERLVDDLLVLVLVLAIHDHTIGRRDPHRQIDRIVLRRLLLSSKLVLLVILDRFLVDGLDQVDADRSSADSGIANVG